LQSLKGDCGIGNAVGVSAGVRVCVGAGDVSGTLEALLLSGTRPASWTEEDRGCSEELLGSDDGAVFVIGAADAACAWVDGDVKTVCDRAVGD